MVVVVLANVDGLGVVPINRAKVTFRSSFGSRTEYTNAAGVASMCFTKGFASDIRVQATGVSFKNYNATGYSSVGAEVTIYNSTIPSEGKVLVTTGKITLPKPAAPSPTRATSAAQAAADKFKADAQALISTVTSKLSALKGTIDSAARSGLTTSNNSVYVSALSGYNSAQSQIDTANRQLRNGQYEAAYNTAKAVNTALTALTTTVNKLPAEVTKFLTQPTKFLTQPTYTQPTYTQPSVSTPTVTATDPAWAGWSAVITRLWWGSVQQKKDANFVVEGEFDKLFFGIRAYKPKGKTSDKIIYGVYIDGSEIGVWNWDVTSNNTGQEDPLWFRVPGSAQSVGTHAVEFRFASSAQVVSAGSTFKVKQWDRTAGIFPYTVIPKALAGSGTVPSVPTPDIPEPTVPTPPTTPPTPPTPQPLPVVLGNRVKLICADVAVEGKPFTVIATYTPFVVEKEDAEIAFVVGGQEMARKQTTSGQATFTWTAQKVSGSRFVKIAVGEVGGTGWDTKIVTVASEANLSAFEQMEADRANARAAAEALEYQRQQAAAAASYYAGIPAPSYTQPGYTPPSPSTVVSDVASGVQTVVEETPQPGKIFVEMPTLPPLWKFEPVLKIDGVRKPIGTHIEVTPGSHKVIIELQGRPTFTQTPYVPAGQTITIPAVNFR